MVEWHPSGQWTDIRYETSGGIAKITIDRPEVRNAFRPLTTKELIAAFEVARDDPATAAPTAARESCASRGAPPVPLVATIAHARSGSTGAASARIVSSSGRTTTDGRARSSNRRCSVSERRRSTGMKDAPECT